MVMVMVMVMVVFLRPRPQGGAGKGASPGSVVSGRQSIMVRSMEALRRQGGAALAPSSAAAGRGSQATECTQSSWLKQCSSRDGGDRLISSLVNDGGAH